MAKSKDKEKKAKTKSSGELVLGSMAVSNRPGSLDELVGQDHIVSQVEGMFKRKRLSNSILINGQSGCGKTTTARIIARILFCMDLQDNYTPCGKCAACSYGQAHPDLHEINMAETRGIDDARALIASSQNMPAFAKYRIFIIDEVHAWTPQAEQAFLKPLEEPPPSTIWILCTTNPEKLKPTILGRMTKFAIRPIEPETMMKRLGTIAKREGVDLKERDDGKKVLRLIADMSNGQMRDAIEILERVVNALAGNKKIDTKTLIETVVTAGEADLDKVSAYLLASILNGDLKDVVQQIRSTTATRGLLSKLRWLIQYLLDNAVGLAKYSPYNAKIFAKVAKDNGITPKLMLLVQLQFALIQIESRMNSMSVDESVLMLSEVGDFISRAIPKKSK